LVRVLLHPHSHTVSEVLASNLTGVNPVPEWLPSQKGWVALWPQAHHK
jgi:hypothetical protein